MKTNGPSDPYRNGYRRSDGAPIQDNEFFLNVTIENGDAALHGPTTDLAASDLDLVLKLVQIIEDRVRVVMMEETWACDVAVMQLPPAHGQKWTTFVPLGSAASGSMLGPTFVVLRVMATEELKSATPMQDPGVADVLAMIMACSWCGPPTASMFNVYASMNPLAANLTNNLLNDSKPIIAQIEPANAHGQLKLMVGRGWNEEQASEAIYKSRQSSGIPPVPSQRSYARSVEMPGISDPVVAAGTRAAQVRPRDCAEPMFMPHNEGDALLSHVEPFPNRDFSGYDNAAPATAVGVHESVGRQAESSRTGQPMLPFPVPSQQRSNHQGAEFTSTMYQGGGGVSDFGSQPPFGLMPHGGGSSFGVEPAFFSSQTAALPGMQQQSPYGALAYGGTSYGGPPQQSFPIGGFATSAYGVGPTQPWEYSQGASQLPALTPDYSQGWNHAGVAPNDNASAGRNKYGPNPPSLASTSGAPMSPPFAHRPILG